MTAPREIHQLQAVSSNSIEALNRLIEELNIRLQAISERLHDKAYFVALKDQDNYDFTLSDFTTDGEWHDMLIPSSVIPDEAMLVVVYIHVQDNAAGNSFEIKAYDNSTDYSSLEVTTNVANYDNDVEGVLDVSNYKRFKYKASNTTFTAINVSLRGYWVF